MRTSLILVAALLGAGCTKTPAYLYGRDLNNMQFHPYSDAEGVYPDRSVLDDPDNPFAMNLPSDDGKWVLEASASPVASFYSWATLNALNPYGEAQFYTGHDLAAVFHTGQTTTPEDLEKARNLGIAAFQAVLDNFPTSVTYDATGKIAYELATLSYQGIVDLKGKVQGGWVLVTGDDGVAHAVKP